MEGHCSTGQSAQWAVVSMEEEEEEKKKKKRRRRSIVYRIGSELLLRILDADV